MSIGKMSKYAPLWEYVSRREGSSLMLSFEDIGQIASVPIDHSFLNAKKELAEYGWEVGKISMKGKTVAFKKLTQ